MSCCHPLCSDRLGVWLFQFFGGMKKKNLEKTPFGKRQITNSIVCPGSGSRCWLVPHQFHHCYLDFHFKLILLILRKLSLLLRCQNNFFTVWVYLEITQDKARITVKDGWVKVSQWTSPLKHFYFILSIKTDKRALPCGKKSYEWVNWILLQGKGRGFIRNSIAQLELVPIMTACLFLTAFWKQRKTR